MRKKTDKEQKNGRKQQKRTRKKTNTGKEDERKKEWK